MFQEKLIKEQTAVLTRIAEALETIAARKPQPRLLVLPIADKLTPTQHERFMRDLSKVLKKALGDDTTDPA